MLWFSGIDIVFRASNKVNMASQYNRQQNRLYPLAEKGFHQAQRNNSHQIWTLLNWEEETNSSQLEAGKNNDEQFQDSINDHPKIPEQSKKEVSFKISKNEEADGQQQKDKAPRDNSFLRSMPVQKKLEQEEIAETELQRLKRKSIEKYIRDQIPFTRTLSNSAFRKFYQRPCQQAYGRTNTHTERGAFYGNFMKTHNIQPHTLDNKPSTYQTYTSALDFGKRTKLDLQDRWKRIERQLAKNLDYRERAYMKAVGQIELDDKSKDGLLKLNIGEVGTSRGRKFPEPQNLTLTKSAKSLGKLETRATFFTTKKGDTESPSEQKRKVKSSQRPLYFVYKYNQNENGYNCTRYARDRHGITCYVDNCFRQKDEAYTQFLKNTKKVSPLKCRPEDVNIDQIRINNCIQSKEEGVLRHYLLPVVETPYEAQKYSRKRVSSVVQTTA